MGLPPHLGGGAPQHAGHRERGDVDRARASRGGNEDDQGRRRRHHAAQPCALCHRRAVRDAGASLSGPHRPRTGPRPRDRPADATRLATRAGGGGNLSAGRPRAPGVPRARRARPAHPGGPCGRNGSAALDSRIEPFRRDARRRAGAALRLRVAFCARTADPRAANLPLPLQAVRTARPALCDGRGQHHRRGDGQGSQAPGHDPADGLHQYLPRRAGLKPAADRRYRDLLVADRKGAGDAHARPLDRRRSKRRPRRRRSAGRRNGCRRAHRGVGRLRPCGAAQVVRADRAALQRLARPARLKRPRLGFEDR